MKILILAERLPSPLGGGSARQFNLIKELSARHRFSILTHAFPEDLIFKQQLNDLVDALEIIPVQIPAVTVDSKVKQRWNSWRHTLFDSNPLRGQFFQTDALREKAACLLKENKFDLIQVHQAYLMSSVPDSNIPIVLDAHDILSDYELSVMRSTHKITHRFQNWIEWKKLITLEQSAAHRARVIVAVSDHDRQKYLEFAPNTQVIIVPNGVDLDYYHPEPNIEQTTDLIFMGSLNYFPNADAVRWFQQEILPKIKSTMPYVTWKVVGWQPPTDIEALHNPPAIDVTGFVDDIRPHLATSRVVVVPLRYGTGTRLKILDAWSMGKAVISTSLGAQGLRASHGKNILLADDPHEFAKNTIQLLSNPDLCEQLGRSGRTTVEEHYSWQSLSHRFETAYQVACSQTS